MTNPAEPSVEKSPFTMPEASAANRSPTLKLCLAFGVGTMGTAVLLNTVTVYLPAFMATVLGHSVALAGLLLTFSKLYDVGCDIVIGLASDQTSSRLGRRRPYMLAGALVGSIAFCMIFNPPFLAQNSIVWEMGFLLVLYSTGYSLFNVPYLALPPELAPDYHGRTRLLSYRTFFVSVGQFIALSISGWILQHLGGSQHAYSIMGYTLGAVILVTELATFFGLHNAPSVPSTPTSLRESLTSLRSLFSNAPFCLLMAAKFLQLVGVSISFSTILLFMLNVLGVGYLGQANFSLAQNIAIALSLPVWVQIGRRIGKRMAAIISVWMYSLVSLTWLLAGHGESVTGLVVRGACLGLAAGGLLLMGSAMLPDAMEYDFLRTGHRREGVFSSCFAVLEKTAFALGPGLIGVYLGFSGYIPTKYGKIIAQPHSVTTALYISAAVLPAIVTSLSTVFLAFYKLDEATLIQARLNAAKPR